MKVKAAPGPGPLSRSPRWNLRRGDGKCVKAFQRAEGILGDGIVGSQTWDHLFTGEEAQFRAIANRWAGASEPRSVEDVRSRKLTIAGGQGIVHGRWYDLEEEYGIRLPVVV